MGPFLAATKGPASPSAGRGKACRTVILPRPFEGEAGAHATAVGGVGDG